MIPFSFYSFQPGFNWGLREGEIFPDSVSTRRQHLLPEASAPPPDEEEEEENNNNNEEEKHDNNDNDASTCYQKPLPHHLPLLNWIG